MDLLLKCIFHFSEGMESDAEKTGENQGSNQHHSGLRTHQTRNL